MDAFVETWQPVFVAALSFPWAYEMCQLYGTGTMYRVAVFPLMACIGLVLPVFINAWLPWVYFPAVFLCSVYFSTATLSALATMRCTCHVLFLTCVSLSCVAAAAVFFLQPLIAHGFQWQFDLPYQSNTVVFLEYALPCLWICLYQRYWLVGLLGFSFPVFYLMTSQMRLHHSFSGLMLWCVPGWPLHYLGTALMLDSALYFTREPRGRYDIMNVIIDSLPVLANLYTAALVLAHYRQTQVIQEKLTAVSVPQIDSEMGHILV